MRMIMSIAKLPVSNWNGAIGGILKGRTQSVSMQQGLDPMCMSLTKPKK